MSESISIPVSIGQVDKAVADLNRLNGTAKDGAASVKRELGEVEKLMKKNLGAELVAQSITKIGTAFGGTAQKAAGFASFVIQGFGQAGPAGAALGVFTGLIDMAAEGMRAAEEAAKAAAKETAEFAAKVEAANAAVREQTRLRDAEIGLRDRGLDAGLASMEVLADDLISERRALDVIDQNIRDKQVEIRKQRAFLLRLGEGAPQLYKDELAAAIAASSALSADREKKVKAIGLLEKQQDEARTKQQRKDSADLAAEDERRAEEAAKAAERAAEEAKKRRIEAAKKAAEEEAAFAEKVYLLNIKFLDDEFKARQEAEAATAARVEARLVVREQAEAALREKERAYEAERIGAEFDLAQAQRDRNAAALSAIEQQGRALDSADFEAWKATGDALDGVTASAEMAGEALQMGAGAAIQAGVAAAIAGENIGGALAASLDATLESIAKESAVQALFNGAKALAALFVDPPAAAGFAGAAAGFAATAVLAGGTAAAIDTPAPSAAGSASTGRSTGSSGRGNDDPGGAAGITLVYSGQVLATRDELARDIESLLTKQRRRA